jgi:hypothetical protein
MAALSDDVKRTTLLIILSRLPPIIAVTVTVKGTPDVALNGALI